MIFRILDLLKKSGCFVKNRLHIYCPGCGGSRAAEALFRLQPFRSLYYNPAVIMLLIVALCIISMKVFESKGGHKLYKERIVVYSLFLVFWFAFFAARNILLLFYGIDMLGDFN